MTVMAGTRVPRTHGIPPMMSGLDATSARKLGLAFWIPISEPLLTIFCPANVPR